MSTTEAENKALVRRDTEEIWENGNFAALPEIMTDDFVLHSPAAPEGIRGREEYQEFVGRFRSAFSDLETEVLRQIAEGDTVVEHHVTRGVHEGDLMGIPPTGNEVEVEGMVIYRIEGGKIAEAWSQADMLGMMRQIGALEGPAG